MRAAWHGHRSRRASSTASKRRRSVRVSCHLTSRSTASRLCHSDVKAYCCTGQLELASHVVASGSGASNSNATGRSAATMRAAT